MNKSKIVKKKLNKELQNKIIQWSYEVYNNEGEKVDIKKEIQSKEQKETLQLNINNNNFYMVKQLNIDTLTNIAKRFWKWNKPWYIYLWYFILIANSVDYNNKIDFNIFKWIWLSLPMIKYIKKKFKETWLIKKYGSDFYINPNMVRKWKNIPKYVYDLFKE
jgi:hypothetical protein